MIALIVLESCGGVVSLVNLGGAVEGFADAATDILGADVAFKFGLTHELGGLFARAA